MVYQGLGVYREPVQRQLISPVPHQYEAFAGQNALHEIPSLGSIPCSPPESDTGMPTSLSLPGAVVNSPHVEVGIETLAAAQNRHQRE